MTSGSGASPPISSNCRWRATASTSSSTARRPIRRPARSCGANPAPTASTPSSSSSIRERRSFPSTFSSRRRRPNADAHHHDLLVANCFAQGQALMRGRTPAEAEALTRKQGASEADADSPRAAQELFRQPSDEHVPLPPPRSAHARAAHRALRAQGVHGRRGLGHQLVRPMGRRTRQGAGLEPRADRRDAAAAISELGRVDGWAGRASARATRRTCERLRRSVGTGRFGRRIDNFLTSRLAHATVFQKYYAIALCRPAEGGAA